MKLNYVSTFHFNNYIWFVYFLMQKTSVERVYKRVAVVEEFFDIIYDIHVNMEGKNGKHAGQKRTYRTVSASNRITLIYLFIY